MWWGHAKDYDIATWMMLQVRPAKSDAMKSAFKKKKRQKLQFVLTLFDFVRRRSQRILW
jgi:GDP-D-mannose dehydratase